MREASVAGMREIRFDFSGDEVKQALVEYALRRLPLGGYWHASMAIDCVGSSEDSGVWKIEGASVILYPVTTAALAEQPLDQQEPSHG